MSDADESSLAIRGKILHFVDEPAVKGEQAWEYFEDGILWVEAGRVKAVGEAASLLPQLSGELTVQEYSNHLIIPGFIDTHIHYPQVEMIAAYGNLHEEGVAHSVEVWQQQQLIGGLYGLSLGQLFFGESMFHRASNASKVALFYLMQHCRSAGFPLIDCQMPNPHLMSLGAKEVSRTEFLSYLKQYRDQTVPPNFWQPSELSELYNF